MGFLTATADLRRILISRTDRLGDVILTLPVAVALRRALPEVDIAFLVTLYTAPLLRRIREIDTVLTVTEKRTGLHLMRIYKPDAVIFARPDFRLALDAVMARIDVRVGTGYRFYSGLFTRWVYDHRRRGVKHESEYSVNLLSPVLGALQNVEMPELPVSEAGAEEAERALQGAGVRGSYMVLHPGDRGSSPNYAPPGYAAVAETLLREHDELTIVVTAGPGERPLAEQVAAGVPYRHRIAIVEGLSLDGLSELLRRARGYLGGASGPAHLAALVGTPVVSLFPALQPVWPARWRPIGPDVATLIPIPEEPQCAVCPGRCEPENCVRRIARERVVEACLQMLERHPVEAPMQGSSPEEV